MSQVKQFNFTQEQIAKLFAMQAELNSYIHPQWKAQEFDWDTAVADECMEIKGHLGWKWWKKDYKVGLVNSNFAQIKLELIDILHFVVSQSIQWGLQGAMLNGSVDLADYTFEQTVQFMLEQAVDPDETADLHQWAVMAHSIGLTEQEILETYTQKYVLNKFRQDHGYKTGEYVKEWLLPVSEHNGAPELHEDNEVLANVVSSRQARLEDTTDEQGLYNDLKYWYDNRLN